MVIAMRRSLCFGVFALALLLAACDGTGPESTLESHFELTASAPVSASLEGKATLGSNLSFSEQSVFVLPIRPFGKTLTLIQLSGKYEESVTHDLSFMHLADGPLEPGTFEVGINAQCDSPCGPGFFPDELFTASYGRQTADSLHFYPLESGTVMVETANDEVVEGTFTLDAAFEASVSRADMEAFRDSLHNGPPSDTTDLPHPPQPTLEPLAPSMTIEGTFTATPGTLSNEVVRPQWSISTPIFTP